MRCPFFIITSFWLLFVPATALSQSDSLPADDLLRVAVLQAPPFAMAENPGVWDGISVYLWREIADDLNLRYEFVPVGHSVQEQALSEGNVDVLLTGIVTAQAENAFDFSHIYYTDRLGIARSKQQSLGSIAQTLLTPRFWSIAASLSVLLLIVGAIVYFIERKSNGEQFGGDGSPWRGIGAGFWWAGVTMTTIGYGDKAPRTLPGRAVALLWMLIAMLITSSLTAALVSATEGRRSVAVPQDLRQEQVLALPASPVADYLEQERVAFQPVSQLLPGLRQVVEGQAEYFVHHTAPLRFALNETANLRLEVQAKDAALRHYALAFRLDSPLRKRINKALLKVINSPQWPGYINRYAPDVP